MSEGSVFKRQDGRFCAKYEDATGKTRYLYRKSKSAAKAALREALKDRDEGIVPETKKTVAALLDQWLEGTRDMVSRRTWVGRECTVRVHIKPSLVLEMVSTALECTLGAVNLGQDLATVGLQPQRRLRLGSKWK